MSVSRQVWETVLQVVRDTVSASCVLGVMDTPAYWDARYTMDTQPFDWYQRW